MKALLVPFIINTSCECLVFGLTHVAGDENAEDGLKSDVLKQIKHPKCLYAVSNQVKNMFQSPSSTVRMPLRLGLGSNTL